MFKIPVNNTKNHFNLDILFMNVFIFYLSTESTSFFCCYFLKINAWIYLTFSCICNFFDFKCSKKGTLVVEGSKRVNFWGLSEIETPKGVIFMRNVKVDNLHIWIFVIDLVLVVNLGGWNPHLVTYYTKKLKVLRRLNWIEENMYTLMNMCSLQNNSQRSH